MAKTVSEIKIISEAEDTILELFYAQNKLMTSDLQGAIEAILWKVWLKAKETVG